MGTQLRIRTLGSLSIELDSQPITEFDSRKVQALLVYLACTERAQPRESLAEMFWEERTQAQSLANLRVALSSLRQTVGPFVDITRDAVSIATDSDIQMDTATFESILDPAGTDVNPLVEAMNLYQGDFLAGFYVDSSAFEEWATRERERLKLRAMDALDRLTVGYTAQGDFQAGIGAATRLLDMDPLREETHRQLMDLLWRSGQRAKALEQYETCRHQLADELGIEPAPDTVNLYERIRTGEAPDTPTLASAVPAPASRTTVSNPYKGLRAFQESDAPNFFGREALTTRLLERLDEDGPYGRFLAVVGPSGCGKSSVVRAGLIPALRGGALTDSKDWRVIQVLPGPHPFDELDIALARLAGDPSIRLLDELCRDTRGLLRAVRRILPDDDLDLLLVIDQFEEVFTLVHDPAEAKFLLDSLYAAVSEPRTPLRLVITLRADFYDRPLMYPDFSEMIRQRTEAVVPLTTDELERAISGPAERAGIALEAGLATTVVSDVSEQPGALPLLQYALTELFDERTDHTLTLAAYHAVGGALGALARRADAVYDSLPLEAQTAARQICLRLVTLGEGTEDIRRRAQQNELLAAGGHATQAVLEAFDRSRLLTFDLDVHHGTSTVELAHEAIIREWSQLRTWLDESRDDVRLQRLLAAAAQEWDNAGQDTSYLLTGSRLAQFEGWANQTDVALTPDERAYLDASVTEDHWQQVKRRRVRNGILAAALITSLVMAILAVFALQSSSTAQQERDSAETARNTAQREAEVRKSVSLAISAKEALLTNNTDLAISLALEANTVSDPPLAARQALAASVYAPGTRLVMTGHTASVNTVAISPDGRYALSGGGRPHMLVRRGVEHFVPNDAQDTSVRLWDLTTGQEIRRFEGHTDSVMAVAFSPDQRRILSASIDQTVMLWDTQTGELIWRIEYPAEILCALFSPDGQYIVTGWADPGIATVLDVETGDIVRRLGAGEGSVWALTFSHDQRYLMSGTGYRGVPSNGYLVIWDWATGEVVHQMQTSSVVSNVAFSPDDRYVLGATGEPLEGTFGLAVSTAIVSMWDLETGQEINRFRSGYNILTDVDFSPDGSQFVSASYDQHLVLWDAKTGVALNRLTGHGNRVYSVAFSPDGNHLLSGSEDGTLRYWDIHHGAEVFYNRAHTSRISDVVFSPDGRLAASSSASRELFLWDVTTGQYIRRFQGHNSGIVKIYFSADGQTIFSGGWDGSIRQWDVNTGEELRKLYTVSGVGLWDFSLSPDERYVLTTEADTSLTPSQLTIYLRDWETGEVIRHFAGHTGLIPSARISPDGRSVVSTSEDNTIRVWDIASGQERCRMRPSSYTFSLEIGPGIAPNLLGAISVGPDSSIALLGAISGRVILADIANCQILYTLEGHGQLIQSVTISPDGHYGISCAEDRLVILWDLTTGNELRRFEGHPNACRAVDFSPDGRYALSGGNDGEVILWRLGDTPEEIIAWGEDNRYVRDLTCTERETYNVTPLCDDGSSLPTRTPYPTLTPSPVPSATPTVDALRVTVLPTWTPIPSNTPPPITAAATAAPVEKGSVTFNAAMTGVLTGTGARQSRDRWTFEGASGQSIQVLNNSADKLITVFTPDQELVAEGTVNLGPITLPETGTYTIVVQSGSVGYGGVYTFTVRTAQD